jgi:ribosomal protein S8E
MPTFPNLFKIVLKLLAGTIRRKKKERKKEGKEKKRERKIKRIHIGKEEIKVSLSEDDIIVYISNPSNTTREHLQLINNFSKLAGFKFSQINQ